MCNSCERCPDDTLGWDCSNVEHSFYRRSYRDCYRNEEVCEAGTDGYLKCAEYHGGCTHEGCRCIYSVLDEDMNRFACAACGFCADGSISYDCTGLGQGFHFCDPSELIDSPEETVCLPDSDGDGFLNCFHVGEDGEECDPMETDCSCEAFVRSTENGDSGPCRSCERCPDDTWAWNCYNLDRAHLQSPFRSCGGEGEHCELMDDDSLYCATYHDGCTEEETCPCIFAIRDSHLGSLPCGECSFCADGSIAYDCSAHGKGSRICFDHEAVCCEDCMDGGVFTNPKCSDCVICDDTDASLFDDVGERQDDWSYFDEESSRQLLAQEPISETPSAAPVALVLPYPLPGIIHRVFY